MKKHSERYEKLISREQPKEGLIFTDEEIEFLCKEDLVGFADKYPEIAEYYMETLSE